MKDRLAHRELWTGCLSNMLPLTLACVKCVSNTGSKLVPTIPRADCLDGKRYVRIDLK